MTSNTCVGCRYNKDCGIIELKSPGTGHWEKNNAGSVNNELGFKAEHVWVQTSEPEVIGTCQTFSCMCPHPATCHDQESDTLRIYTKVAEPGRVEECVLEQGCEHYTPTDDVLWNGNDIRGWLQSNIIKLGVDGAIEVIAQKIESLIVE